MRFRALVTVGFGVLFACAEGGQLLDDDDDDTPLPNQDGGNASSSGGKGTSSSSGSSNGGSSSSSTSSGSSSGALEDGGGSSSSSSSSGAPLTACQQALAGILFDVDDTPPEVGTDWRVGLTEGFAITDTRWPFQPWLFSTPSTAVIPTKCPDQSGCVGTSMTKNYVQCQRGWIATPIANLSACAGKNVVVKFDQAYAFNEYDTKKDGGIVEVSGNAEDFNSATWTRLDSADMPGTVSIRGSYSGEKCLSDNSFYVNGKRGYVGSRTTLHTVSLTLPPAALTAQARVRFVFASGVAYGGTNAETSRDYTKFGWRVDNVRFEELP